MCWAERFSAWLNLKAWTEIPRLLYNSTTTLSGSIIGRNSNEDVLHIHQWSRSKLSLSDCLVSYQEQPLQVESYFISESAYSETPADWDVFLTWNFWIWFYYRNALEKRFWYRKQRRHLMFPYSLVDLFKSLYESLVGMNLGRRRIFPKYFRLPTRPIIVWSKWNIMEYQTLSRVCRNFWNEAW